MILPQRNPLVLAKQVASLDVLSGGRVMLGIGAGYLEPEFHAVARGHGWYGYALTPQQAATSVAGLAAAADRVQRPTELGELEISVTPSGQLTRELAAEFAEAGVHRLVLLASPTPDGPQQTVQAGAEAISGL